MHYADVFNLLGPMPINGSPYDADCAIALSMARNSVSDNHLPDIRSCRDALKDDITAIKHLSHPYFSGFDPGKPNRDIAIYGTHCIEDGLPLIAQWEISMALYRQRNVEWMEEKLVHQQILCLWPPNRPSYRTIEVLEDAFKITQEHGWKRPVLLAHDYHMPRVAMLARHFWPEFIIGFPAITRAFDKKSVQPMCASPAQWYRYEIKGRAHHLLYGWCFGRFASGRF